MSGGIGEAFQRGDDLHEHTARWVLGKPVVSKEERQLARGLESGLIYDIGSKKLRRYAKGVCSRNMALDEREL
ncbi:hypothetical protein HRbin36_00585 [bacterium HR36]|nr:hypothetical protein HRbin36_00585 [bacterium HR36]